MGSAKIYLLVKYFLPRLSATPAESLRLSSTEEARGARATERIYTLASLGTLVPPRIHDYFPEPVPAFTCAAFPRVQPRIAATDKPTYKYPRQLCIQTISRRITRRGGLVIKIRVHRNFVIFQLAARVHFANERFNWLELRANRSLAFVMKGVSISEVVCVVFTMNRVRNSMSLKNLNARLRLEREVPHLYDRISIQKIL